MKKNLFKRGMAGLLSLVMCLTALVGIGTTTAYAAGERAEVYLVSFPRSGDANIDYSGTWGHPNLRYMNGWHSGASKYTTIRAMHSYDGKGIRISKGIGSDKPHIDLKWSQVEKRIAELIKLDRYLNPKEKAQYPEWLQRQEERRAALAEERRNREILSTAPSEKAEAKNEQYEYHLGSTVYLGANEYEILSFDDERVMLYDTQFPLFNKEMTRTEFDSKVQENPLNDHLKVVEKHREEKAVEFDIGMGYLGNGLTVWNRAVEVNGDYQNIAHISPEGEITFYVQDLPQSVVERIRQAAEREKSKDAALPEFYQAYLKTKADNPSSLLLYQVGDFFEAYADDAEVVGTALDLTQTTRAVDHNTRVPMVGFPQHRLETYLTMLTDRGYDIEVNALEDGKRITRTVVSTTKEAPIESKPIGRIDYLGTDGKVGESIEYTSPYQFEKDIKEENYYGVPMSIVLYRDKDGNTIPHGFIAQLDPPPKSFEIIDSPYLPENALDKAKHLIDDFCREEYQREDGADYTDLTNVGIAYTTTEDDKHEIQARVNLVDFRIETLADGKVVRSEQYASIEELTEKGLQALSFDDLVYLSEEELAQVEAPLAPAWEHPKKSRVQTFDTHPEIPMADRHTFDLASHEVEEVNKKERFHRNYAAITVLKRCQEENRFATPDEQIILSKYVGWGGIPEAFDERAGSWQTEFGMLKNILTPEEYASARESTLTAFYTPPTVINAVYKVMKQLGFREGNILEPSCGIGHFIGMLPEEMKESKIYGVELDTVSAGIAQQLYQKSSIAAQGFEETNLPDSFFDAVVGNVPFGDFKVSDKRYDKHKFLIHDFFFAKSLDKLRPGGVMALITSKGTMDKETSAVRKYIAQRADLLGAIRLPNNTFKGNAGTEVVSDILKVQCFLNDFVGVDAPRTVGTVCLHIAAVIGLALNIPLAGVGREMNLDVPLCVPRCSQELKHKLFDNFGRQPSSTKPNGDLAGGQVFRLYPFQCFHIYGVIFRVKLRRLSGEYQLFPDIAGEVFVCHQVLCLRGIAVPVHRVQKDNALQVRKDFFLGLAGQLAHIIHIHTGFFAHRNGKRFAGGIYGSDRGVWLDGSLVENIRLAFKLPFIAQDLKSREQRKGAVLRKCGDVGTAVDKSVLLGKGIIKSV